MNTQARQGSSNLPNITQEGSNSSSTMFEQGAPGNQNPMDISSPGNQNVDPELIRYIHAIVNEKFLLLQNSANITRELQATYANMQADIVQLRNTQENFAADLQRLQTSLDNFGSGMQSLSNTITELSGNIHETINTCMETAMHRYSDLITKKFEELQQCSAQYVNNPCSNSNVQVSNVIPVPSPLAPSKLSQAANNNQALERALSQPNLTAAPAPKSNSTPQHAEMPEGNVMDVDPSARAKRPNFPKSIETPDSKKARKNTQSPARSLSQGRSPTSSTLINVTANQDKDLPSLASTSKTTSRSSRSPFNGPNKLNSTSRTTSASRNQPNQSGKSNSPIGPSVTNQQRLFSEPTIPPIIVANPVPDWEILSTKLETAASEKITTHYTRGGYTRIYTNTEEDFHSVSQALAQETTLQYHTYQAPSAKPLKIVLRPIPYGWSEESIAKMLSQIGYETQKVIRLTKKVTREGKITTVPTPLMLVLLSNIKDHRSIKDLKQLHSIRLDSVEDYRGDIAPLQCFKCQQFNHVAPGCHHQPRCNRCAEAHETKDCTKEKEEFQARCANCNGPHAASYGGCPVFKRLVTQRKNARFPQPTYATVTQNKPQEDIQTMVQQMRTILRKFDAMTK